MSAHQFTTPLYYYTLLLLRCNKNVLFIIIIISMHASYQLPLTATTDIRGTSSPQSLSLNVVRERALESRTEVLKGHNSGFRSPDRDDSLSLLARASGSRWFWVQAQWPQSHRAPPTLVDATSRLIYDVLVYSHLWCTCLLSTRWFN